MRRRCGPPSRFWDAQYVLGCLAAACLAGVPAQGQCQYDVTIIQAPICPPPLPEPPATFPTGLNELGEVVGYHRQCDDPTLREAFRWTPEAGFVTIQRPPGVRTARAFDSNDAGEIVGELDIAGDGLGVLAFLHDGNDFIEIHPPAGTFSQAAAISNQTEVAGTTADGSPFFKAFLWENDVMTLLLPTFGPRSVTRDINDAGQIVGWMGTSNTIDSHAFLWKDELMTDLGLIPGSFVSQANAINNLDDIVITGRIQQNGSSPFLTHSFLWSDGRFTDLGLLPGFDRCSAVDINDARTVAGVCSQSANPNNSVPFLWKNGVMSDLTQLLTDNPGIQLLRTVSSINNAGQIVGKAIGLDGHVLAVLLTPVSASPADVNNDCVVNVLDLIELLLCFGQAGDPPCNLADINQDGTVNVLDLIVLLLDWG